MPHNRPDGTPLQGVLYIREPGGDEFVAIPLEIERYTLQQHATIRKSTGQTEADNRMPIIVYGTALGIVHNPEFDPFTNTPKGITP